MLPQLVKNNMHQTNTYFCEEFLRAVYYFPIKLAKKYLKKFEKPSISVFHCACFLATWRFYNKSFAIWEVERFANKFKSHLFKQSWSEKAFLFIFYLLFIFFIFSKLQRTYKQNINKTEYKNNVTISVSVEEGKIKELTGKKLVEDRVGFLTAIKTKSGNLMRT